MLADSTGDEDDKYEQFVMASIFLMAILVNSCIVLL